MMEIEIKGAEALVIGPDDALLIAIPTDQCITFDDQGNEVSLAEELSKRLQEMGMQDRCLVICADELQMAVIQRPSVAMGPTMASLEISEHLKPRGE
jgi:hypothetical protein